MNILITDVTEMQGGNYCVAGWNIAEQRMVRPLPNGNNWTAGLLQKHGVECGLTLRVMPIGIPTGTYPHRTEDTPIDSASIEVIDAGFSSWLDLGAPPASESLDAGFAGNLRWNKEWNGVRQGVHVLPGTEYNSLAAIRVNRTDLSFSEPFDKLKATVSDRENRYQLAVSSRILKEAWRDGGLLAVNNALPSRRTFYVRVGVSRQFGNPPKCFAMVNSVL